MVGGAGRGRHAEACLENSCFAVMRSSSEEGSYLMLVHFGITQLYAERIKKKKKKHQTLKKVAHNPKSTPPSRSGMRWGEQDPSQHSHSNTKHAKHTEHQIPNTQHQIKSPHTKPPVTPKGRTQPKPLTLNTIRGPKTQPPEQEWDAVWGAGREGHAGA